MALPQSKIVSPANACENRSILPRGNFEMPNDNPITMVNMVASVVIPKTNAIAATEAILASAAGYIRSGINGSQGPKTKIVNRIHGVIFFVSFVSCTCAC